MKNWLKWLKRQLKPQGFWIHIWVIAPILRFFLRRTVQLGIFDVENHGRNENVPKKGPVILASTHLSFSDPVCLLGALRRNAVAMAAKELWRNPVFAPLLILLRHIPVDRKDRDSGQKAKEKFLRFLKHGGAGIIYPEGRISKVIDGEKEGVLPLKRGVYDIALESGAPVVPVGVIGTDELWPLGTKKINRKAKVIQNFGEPIYAKDYKGREEFLNDLHLRLQQLSSQRLAEN